MHKRRLRKLYIRAIRRMPHGGGHGVHSPFAFRLITRVVEETLPYYCYKEIEGLRPIRSRGKTLLRLRREMSAKEGALLFRLVNHFKPRTLIELGSSWGVSTLYMQAGAPQASYHCIEPFAESFAATQELVERRGCEVTLYQAPLLEQLAQLLKGECKEIDFLFVHQLHPSLYAPLLELIVPHLGAQSVVVVDGIHRSKRSLARWREVVAHPQIRVSMDLLQFGILVANPKYNKQHYTVGF